MLVRFAPPSSVVVSEGGGTATLCTEIVTGTLSAGATASVTLTTFDGTAQRKETKNSSAIVCTEDHSLNVLAMPSFSL